MLLQSSILLLPTDSSSSLTVKGGWSSSSTTFESEYNLIGLSCSSLNDFVASLSLSSAQTQSGVGLFSKDSKHDWVGEGVDLLGNGWSGPGLLKIY
eukprot:scaffold1786_cov104-Skeletonema_dohrnii-CCMP3373.AAC.4